jgi:hypothetical protein
VIHIPRSAREDDGQLWVALHLSGCAPGEGAGVRGAPRADRDNDGHAKSGHQSCEQECGKPYEAVDLGLLRDALAGTFILEVLGELLPAALAHVPLTPL